MKYCMTKLSNLTDSESALNNYAEPSLNLAANRRNRSKQFRTKLSIDNPLVQTLLPPKVESTKFENEEIEKFCEILKATKQDKAIKNENKATNNIVTKAMKNDSMEVDTVRTDFPESRHLAPKISNPIVSLPPPHPSFKSFGENPKSDPKFGLPRPPLSIVQPKFPPIQRQGSFGRSNSIPNGQSTFLIGISTRN